MLVEVDNDRDEGAAAPPPGSSSRGVVSLSRSLSTHLDAAARHGDFALVSRLLQATRAAGMLVDGGNRGSLFMSAAFGGNANVVRALAQAGRGGNGSGGPVGIGDAVLADINKVDLSTGQRPLHVATRLGHRPAVRALLFYGADVNATVQPLSSSKVSWPKTLLGGMTALHWASLRGYSEIVQDLIMSGGDLNARVSHSGETPLHLAARHGQAAAVGVLLDAGAAPLVYSRHNLSPMDLAASSNDSSTLIEFLHRGMDPNARNALGYTAVHQAAYSNSSDTLRLLLASGGSASSATDVGHYTPLHVAAAFSTRSSSATGSAAPAAGYITATSNNNKDNTADHHTPPPAASAVRTIVRYGGGGLGDVLRVDALDAEGSTPLHTACVNLQEAAVRDLLDVGANEQLFTLSIGDFVKTDPHHYLYAGDGGGGTRGRTESIARVMAMLAAAPADRAWRRRGWLAVLRARATAARAAAVLESISRFYSSSSGGGGGGDDKGSDGRISSRKRSSFDATTDDFVEGSGRSKACRFTTEGWKAAGGDGGGCALGVGGLAAVVKSATALEDEGIFRRIVLFL